MAKEVEITKETNRAIIEGLTKAVTADSANSRIEYSTDGGFSYQPLRFSLASTDIAVHQIIDIVNKNYKVRYVRLDQKDANVSAFGDYISKVTGSTAAPQKSTREKIDHFVISKSPAGYTTNKLGLSDRVSQIEVTTRFKMNEPNTNRVVNVYDYNAPGPIQRGHIYQIQPPPGYSSDLAYLIGSGRGQDIGITPDWCQVSCPRVFDLETESLFRTIPKVTLLGGKYIVLGNNFQKLGSTFYIPPDRVFDAVHKIREYGGQVDIRLNEKLHTAGVVYDMGEIMEYVNELAQYVSNSMVGKDEEVAEAIARAIQYRDAAVDQLKVLNEQIKTAREILNQRAANEAVSRIQTTA